MMRLARLLLLSVSIGVLGVASAAAQDVGPVPAPGMMAFGASIGAAPPLEASFTNGLDLAANVEGYLTRRVSIRGQVSGSFWDITGRGFTGTVRPVAFTGNAVYNWEGGKIHPFVTGGAGLYHFRFAENPTTGSATKPGVNFGGGMEYFFRRHTTATAEALYHAVKGPLHSPLTTYNDNDYWTFRAGLKRYF